MLKDAHWLIRTRLCKQSHVAEMTSSVCTLNTLKSVLGGSDKGIVLNDLALIFRFGVIFKKCFKGKFSKCNEHLW